jgi:hypothetical protein
VWCDQEVSRLNLWKLTCPSYRDRGLISFSIYRRQFIFNIIKSLDFKFYIYRKLEKYYSELCMVNRSLSYLWNIVWLKTAEHAGLSGQVHYGESATEWIPTSALHYGDVSRLVNRNTD